MMVSPQHQLLRTQLLLVFLLLPLPLHASLRDSHSSVRDSRASLRDSHASVGDSDVSVRDKVAKCLDQLFHADVAFWVDSQVKIF